MTEFGTMADMERLISEMHKRDMKLIMDLVPNHTSTAHRWFQESRKGKDNPYSDYYYWFDEIPNDWQSAFRGSAWEYDPMRGQYYLHSFAVSQADLNWENPAVIKAMQDVVDFWIDKGVDGFRIDVIDMISKDFEKKQDGFGPRLHEFIRALFDREKARFLFTVGESGVHDIDEMISFRSRASASGESLSAGMVTVKRLSGTGDSSAAASQGALSSVSISEHTVSTAQENPRSASAAASRSAAVSFSDGTRRSEASRARRPTPNS